MDIKKSLLGLTIILGASSPVLAGNISIIALPQGYHPVISLQGGYASINAGNNSKRFIGTDDEAFTYNHANKDQDSGFISAFLGAEYTVSRFLPVGYFLQTGVEYDRFGRIGISGMNTAGIEPQTSTTYHYNYNFQTQQYLAVLKLFATAYKQLHPYGEVGLGAATNQTGQYSARTTETGSINLTPAFSGNSQTQFSYMLGLGLEADVSDRMRVGVGYRYSNFGSSTLGNGAVSINNYRAPVDFSLKNSNSYANQLIFRISYIA